MPIEIINGIRVITPSENYWLYSEKDKIISDKVYLGINAKETDWIEITEENKAEFEALWEIEEIPEDMTTEEVL